MNLVTDAFAALAWNQFVQVTAVALFVGLVVRLACRRRPHLAYALWMLVIVKSLTPPLWSSPTGVFSWLQAETVVVNTNASAGEFLGTPPEPLPLAQEPGGTGVSPVFLDDRQGNGKLPVPHNSHSLLVIWLAGVALMGCVVLVRRFQFARLLRFSAISVDEPFKRYINHLAERIGLRRRVRVVVSTEPIGPAVFGVLRPTVVLPTRLLAEKTWAELEPILAHEIVHLRRRDTLAGGLQVLAQILWWFHPLIWWSNREARRERERCCDQEVLTRLGCGSSVYARALLHVLQWRRTLRPVFALSATSSWSVTSTRLEEIMRNVKAHRNTPRWVWLALVTASAMMLPGAGLERDAATEQNDVDSVLARQRRQVDELNRRLRERAKRHQKDARSETEPDEVRTSQNQIVRDRGGVNMRRIASAMIQYLDEHQLTLPSAASYLKGEPLLSWRVHILPYLDEEALYREFRLDEPWDSAHNRELIKRMPAVYKCPGQKTDEGKTCFLVPSGEKTLFPPQVVDGISVHDITDGLGYTILLVDVNDQHAVVWTKPEDFQYDPDENPIPKLVGHHQGGFSIFMVNGLWLFLPENLADLKTLHAMFTYNGGEPVEYPLK